jgi:hypothetical protein
MRKFLFEFVSNLISFLLFLVIGGILMSLLFLSMVCGSKSNMLAALGCLGLIVIIVALIPTTIQFLEPYHPIDKLAKLITRYNDTN